MSKPSAGISLFGDLRSGTGLSEAARNLTDALMLLDNPLDLIEVLYPDWGGRALPERYGRLLDQKLNPINLFLYNFNVFDDVMPLVSSLRKAKRYTLGYWFWELEELPTHYREKIRSVDEVWVASNHVANAMRTMTDKPISVIPTPMNFESRSPITKGRNDFGLPEHRFLFMFSFSAASSVARKNPWAIVRAYEHAFKDVPAHERPVLAIKFHGAKENPAATRALQQELNRIGGILLTEPLSREDMNSLLACADCYVSLHRAEGYGLGMIEAMSYGVPVIGTAYSANEDYLTEENGYPVRYVKRPIALEDHRFDAEFASLYEPGYLWAEPDLNHSAERMREAFFNRDELKAKGKRAAEDVRRYCSVEVVAEICRKRMDEISARLSNFEPSEVAASLIPKPKEGLAREAKQVASDLGESGVNFVGDVLFDAGLGVAMRSMIEACKAREIPFSLVPLHEGFREIKDYKVEELPTGSRYAVNILSRNMQQVAAMSDYELSQALRQHYTVANWYWELGSVPLKYAKAFKKVQEVWAASHFVRESFQTMTDHPVIVIPPSVVVQPPGKYDRKHFGIDEGRFVFLFTYAATSCTTRKNPWGLMDAYEKAFSGQGKDKPLLVIKVSNMTATPEMEELLVPRAKEVGALLIDKHYSLAEMQDLQNLADAYVSLHRSEGFGLGMAESMLLGKPVIGTRYSANIDFMTDDNSYLIDFRLVEVGKTEFRGDEVFRETYTDADAVWAEADVDQAAAAMRRIVENPAEAKAKGEAARKTIQAYCSPEAVGDKMAARLAEIERAYLPHYVPDELMLDSTIEYLEAQVFALRAGNLQYLRAAQRWHQIRIKDYAYSGKIPVFSGILRLFIRPFLIGKMNDQVALMQEIQEKNTELLAKSLEAAANCLRSIKDREPK